MNKSNEKTLEEYVENLIKIENTRVLYSFMQEIEQFYFNSKYSIKIKEYIKKNKEEPSCDYCILKYFSYLNNYNEAKESIVGAIKELLKNAFVGNKISAHNVFYRHIEFWNESRSNQAEKIVADNNGNISLCDTTLEKITCIFIYFLILDKLKIRKESVYVNSNEECIDIFLPYLYEVICNAICDFTDSSMCYFAYKKENNVPQIYAHSSELVNLIRNGRFFSSNDIDQIIQDLENNNKILKNLNYGTFDRNRVNTGEGNNTDNLPYISIKLPFSENRINSAFYIILQKENDNFKDEIIEIATNILIMRDSLLKAFYADYSKLLNYNDDYGYIRRFAQNTTVTKLLHISDLHIGGKAKEGNDSKPINWEIVEKENCINAYSRFSESIKLEFKKNNSQNVDLLVISGDLVQGNTEASNIQMNYQEAKKVITNIAICLWSDTERNNNYDENKCRICHDWYKRIIIATGNHDYATMNDLKVVPQSGRMTSVAMSASSIHKSGPMAKFAYYIEFMMDLFKMPYERVVQDQLNEVRDYKELDLKVIVLNSSVDVNVNQNNKVSLDNDSITRLSKRFNLIKRKYSLCVVHHSPLYVKNNLDYLDDMYNIKSAMGDKSCKCFYYFAKKTKNKSIEKLIKSINDYIKGIKNNQNLSIFYDEFKKLQKKVGYDYKQTPLYQDMEILYNFIDTLRNNNNLLQVQGDNIVFHLLEKLSRASYMMEADKKAYNDVFGKIKKIDLVCSGHIHEIMINGETVNKYHKDEIINKNEEDYAEITMGYAHKCYAVVTFNNKNIFLRIKNFDG